ncbi:unnamed protein product [Closterium sp. NIES-64]|nr:unnamed protein product [Closterium sp. NIES-64]
MDSFNSGASPPPRRLEPDPFTRLSDDLVAHILALVASNGFRFLPKPRLTTAAAAAAAASGTTSATAGAAAATAVTVAATEDNAGGGGASAERDDVNAVNGSVNSEDEDAFGDASEDELRSFTALWLPPPFWTTHLPIFLATTAGALPTPCLLYTVCRVIELHRDTSQKTSSLLMADKLVP